MSQYPQRKWTIDEDNNRLNRGNFFVNVMILGLTVYIAHINTLNYEINLKTLERNTRNVGNTKRMADSLEHISELLDSIIDDDVTHT